MLYILCTYIIEYTVEARKNLRKMAPETGKLLVKKIIQLSLNPSATNNNVKALKGINGFRLRVGNYRIIYTVLNDKTIIRIIKIGHRKDVYKWN